MGGVDAFAGHKMTEGFGNQDAHAYVDNCLEPSRRLAFEAAMRRDARLRAKVEAWDAQNEAIRIAFSGTARAPRTSPSLYRLPKDGGSSPVFHSGNESGAPPRQALAKKIASRLAFPAWRLAVGCAVFAFISLAASGYPKDPRPELLQRVEVGLRMASSSGAKLDYASDRPAAILQWLGGRFLTANLPSVRAKGWILLGVRVIPGISTGAALFVFQDAIGGLGVLLVEPTDAMPDLGLRSERAGNFMRAASIEHGVAYAVAGPAGSSVFDLLPLANDQVGP